MKQLLINCLQTSPWSSNFMLSFLVQGQYWFFGSHLCLNCSVCVSSISAYKGTTGKGRVLQCYFALCCLMLSSDSDVDNKLGFQHFLSHVIVLSEHCVQFTFISACILKVAEGLSRHYCPFACQSPCCFLSAQHTGKLILLYSHLSQLSFLSCTENTELKR